MPAPRLIGQRFLIADPQNDLLGAGGMGVVYLAVDQHSGGQVAVKALKPDFVRRSPEIVARFEREGETLRQLNHPNIVHRVTALEEDGEYFLVMEYIAGGSLGDLLAKQGRLPVERVLKIALELSDALTRAHHLGIIHRDLKPANILLDEEGTPHLTDFGIAHVGASSRITEAGVLLGTIDYLSPEICQGQPVDRRADIWAFGVLLYEMLAGAPPFPGETPMAKITAILTQPTPDLLAARPDTPEALADLIYRMLEKDPQQRLPSMRLAAAELEALVEARPLTLPPGLETPSRITPPPSGLPLQSSTPIPRRRRNLPTQPTPFIGREAELAEVARLMEDPDVRLLTILSIGGMGKTRLALEYAARHADDYTHGAVFVSLAPLHTSEEIIPALGTALGINFNSSSELRRQLLEYLADKHLLLVLDNYEHLLESAGLASEITSAAPQVKILATSRERLSLQVEQLFHLEGMDFPDWETPQDALEYGAVRLFLQSARRVQPGFDLAEADLKYVARICKTLQGMPLGILLAAAWVEMMTPEEIAAETSQGLDFLESDSRDLPDRQRSLRSVFEYSWNLLSASERAAFKGLAVFRGGFTRQAAQEIGQVSLRDLMALVNRSLLHRTPSGRYELHELLRQYANEKLTQGADGGRELRDRHATFYMAFTAQFLAGMGSAQQGAWWEKMGREHKNVRAAWEWAIERRRFDWLAEAAYGLSWFCNSFLDYQSGWQLFHLAVERLQDTAAPQERQSLARLMSLEAFFHPDDDATTGLLKNCLALLAELESAGLDVRLERAWLMFVRGEVQANLDRRAACDDLEQSLALFKELGRTWESTHPLNRMSQHLHDLGRLDEARRCAEESLAICEALPDRIGNIFALYRLGQVAWVQGRLEEAEGLMRQAFDLAQVSQDASAIFTRTLSLAESLERLGRFDEAIVLIYECLEMYEAAGYPTTWAYYNLINTFQAEIEVHLGLYENALRHKFDRTFVWGNGFNHFVHGMALLGLGRLEEAAGTFEKSEAVFRRIAHRENLGWALSASTYLYLRQGQIEAARQRLLEALRLAQATGTFFPYLHGLPAAAWLLGEDGRPEQALEFYALARRYGFVANSKWFEEMAAAPLEAMRAGLGEEAAEAAQGRGEAREVWGSLGELIEWLERDWTTEGAK